MARKAKKPVKGHQPGSYQLPGVGEGLVDPDFDALGDAERDAIVEGVVGHDRAEDYD
jgi:hypothetical protein